MSLSRRQLVIFRRRLLAWYAEHGRRGLPWRDGVITPYSVWISEVMLQQTVVGTVKARFAEWLEQFPDVAALASADEQQVLAAWEGLGYYRRASNAWRAARAMVERFGGEVPRARADLESLCGIGTYVASAVRSIAFGEDEVALDANLVRVFARLCGIGGYATDSAVRRQAGEAAALGLPPGRSSDYNQALMDFGSLVCRPQNPLCDECFARRTCVARREGSQNDIPRKRKKRLTRVEAAVGVFVDGERVYIQKRPPGGRFAGMWEFPGGKLRRGETPAEALVREVREELSVACRPGAPLAPIVHHYTVFEVTLHAFVCEAPAPGLPEDETHRWVARGKLTHHPMPSANRRLLDALDDQLRGR